MSTATPGCGATEVSRWSYLFATTHTAHGAPACFLGWQTLGMLDPGLTLWVFPWRTVVAQTFRQILVAAPTPTNPTIFSKLGQLITEAFDQYRHD